MILWLVSCQILALIRKCHRAEILKGWVLAIGFLLNLTDSQEEETLIGGEMQQLKALLYYHNGVVTTRSIQQRHL